MNLESFNCSSFIRLSDYLIVNTMHVLAVNSVSTLLNYLTEHLQTTPPLQELQKWITDLEENVIEVTIEDEDGSRSKAKSPSNISEPRESWMTRPSMDEPSRVSDMYVFLFLFYSVASCK